MGTKKHLLGIGSGALAIVAMAGTNAFGQPAFSIDVQGPTVTAGTPSSAPGIPIMGDDVLLPPGGAPGPGPLPPPDVMVSGGPPAGLFGTLGLGSRGELDALSGGADAFGDNWFFSVDEWAGGDPGAPAAPPSSVTSEGAIFFGEAAADIFTTAGPPAGFNVDVIDGNGLSTPVPPPPSFAGPGLGLVEPNLFGAGTPDAGDNLDGLDMEALTPHGGFFFSLDSAFADPLEAVIAPPNFGTAAANGFVGGDVLFSAGVPALYAAAATLGLDIAGADTDDLDALVLLERSGDLTYTPGIDKLAFSVRRGSAVIGALDSLLGIPIEEGDILVPPAPGSPAGTTPGILVTAEALGLGTVRSGTSLFLSLGVGDDLDALDVVPEPATVSLLALGGLAMLRRRRQR